MKKYFLLVLMICVLCCNVNGQRNIQGKVKLTDSSGTTINPVKEDGNLATIKTNTDKIPASPATEGKQDNNIVQTTATNTKLGEVQVSPTENTILDRLKDLLTGIILDAGNAIIGNVGIDQTTPGTTNGVQVNVALPTGSNKIGLVDINTTNGVPNTFTKTMKQGISYNIQKGAVNKLRQRPQILNEQQEESDDVTDVVESGVIVGQIFKASANNINSISLTLDSAQARTELDNFETGTYGNDGALQAVWVKQGTDEAVRELSIIKNPSEHGTSSNMSMKLDMGESDGDWLATTTALPINTSPIDLTGATIALDYYQTDTYDNAKMAIYIEDSGANESEVDLVVNAENNWQHFEISVASFSGSADITDITKIGFRINSKKAGKFGYLDNLQYVISTGSIDIKLWDMGSDIPVSITTSLDDGVQYTELGDRGLPGGVVVSAVNLSLLGGTRMYHIHDFVAGAAEEKTSNTTLTIGNYYAITLHYVDENVSVYGYSDSNIYSNGYSFYTPDTSTVITSHGANNDLMFYIYSTQQVYITEYHFHAMDSDGVAAMPGINSEWTVLVEDENINVEVLDHHHSHPINDGGTVGVHKHNLELRPVVLNKGGKFEVYYTANSDDVAEIIVEIIFLHIPPTPNG